MLAFLVQVNNSSVQVNISGDSIVHGHKIIVIRTTIVLYLAVISSNCQYFLFPVIILHKPTL